MDKHDFLAKVQREMDPRWVAIDAMAIESLEVDCRDDAMPMDAPPHPEDAVDVCWFALALNSINHQFWSIRGEEFARYGHAGKVGALAMREGLQALWMQSRDMELSVDLMKFYFGDIPDPEDRMACLAEVLSAKGRLLAQRLAQTIGQNAAWDIEWARRISIEFPRGYGDPFLKKAQLALWMAKGMLKSGGIEAPVVDLTCFADYQVPKVLRGLGILSYAPGLAAMVDAGKLIEQDSPMEVAIRSASIVACEMISKKKGVSSAGLDFWLWQRRNDFDALFHRTLTRRY